ncbi:MAG: hypothetical protein KIS91_20245, partial [Anaerolineae bacterium]|nr:hypothetical protein [Anaerolineae bacterium]
MKLARLLALVALLISVAVSVGPVLAQQPDATSGRNEVAEQEILDRLALVNPAAVSLFQAATQALDSGDYAPAKQGFEAVLDLAAEFPDAERRLSYVEVRLKNYPSAIAHAERALSADPSPFNHRALAEALLASGEARQARAAYDHARMAVKGLPNDAGTQQILLLAASNVHEKQVAREASARLLALAPTYAPSHYFAGLLAGMDGQWEKAEAELLEAQQLGMPAEQVQRVLDETGIHRQAQMRRIIRGGVWGLVGWLVTGALLFVVGLALSRATLAAVARYKTDSQATMGTAEARVRSVYRLVIALTSLYFYVSIPILILLVVAITLGLLFLLMTLEYIPVRLAFVIGIIGLVTLSALVKSVLFRLRDTVPGRPLTREEAPALWVLATNVAHRLGTRPIDAIYITPGTDMAVTERGGLLKKLRGDGQRCLILGLGVLPGMTQGQFEAILGHEYGHFNHRDTAGGDLALPVEIAIHRL